jgi:hypothetical protein
LRLEHDAVNDRLLGVTQKNGRGLEAAEFCEFGQLGHTICSNVFVFSDAFLDQIAGIGESNPTVLPPISVSNPIQDKRWVWMLRECAIRRPRTPCFEGI